MLFISNLSPACWPFHPSLCDSFCRITSLDFFHLNIQILGLKRNNLPVRVAWNIASVWMVAGQHRLQTISYFIVLSTSFPCPVHQPHLHQPENLSPVSFPTSTAVLNRLNHLSPRENSNPQLPPLTTYPIGNERF